MKSKILMMLLVSASLLTTAIEAAPPVDSPKTVTVAYRRPGPIRKFFRRLTNAERRKNFMIRWLLFRR